MNIRIAKPNLLALMAAIIVAGDLNKDVMNAVLKAEHILNVIQDEGLGNN